MSNITMDTSLKIPQLFMQIHYHNRPCGVTKVIEGYFQSFHRLVVQPSQSKSIFIGNDHYKSTWDGGNNQIISLKECDYREFQSKSEFDLVENHLLNIIGAVLANPSVPKPICVLGHNLSLGKNVALSACFMKLAKHYAGDKMINFFMIIHDFVEEGRIKLMGSMEKMAGLGIPIIKVLYPLINVHYVVLNVRNFALLTRAGLSVSLLPNPLFVPNAYSQVNSSERIVIDQAIQQLAQKDRVTFHLHAPTYFYPVRVIARKNVLEALIVICLLLKGNLLIGGYGTSKKDKVLLNRIRHLAKKYHLPLILDIERLKNYLGSNRIHNHDLFSFLYSYTDYCLTTSLVEGFGYALFEPWLYGKMVIGRLPLGIHENENANLSNLYKKFLIPVSWVLINQLEKKYYHQLRQMDSVHNIFLSKEEFHKHFHQTFIHNGYIDFGVLDQETQFLIAKNCCIACQYGEELSCLKLVNPDIKKWAQPGTEGELNFLLKNQEIVSKTLAVKPFDQKFSDCFFQSHDFTEKSNFKHGIVQRYFCSLDNFRLIMAH